MYGFTATVSNVHQSNRIKFLNSSAFSQQTPTHRFSRHHLDIADVKINLLSCLLLQAMYQHFLEQWQVDHPHRPQQRNKWKVSASEPIGAGTITVLREENWPLLRCRVDRIATLHPGKDSTSRVLSVKTADDVVKCPTTRVRTKGQGRRNGSECVRTHSTC